MQRICLIQIWDFQVYSIVFLILLLNVQRKVTPIEQLQALSEIGKSQTLLMSVFGRPVMDAVHTVKMKPFIFNHEPYGYKRLALIAYTVLEGIFYDIDKQQRRKAYPLTVTFGQMETDVYFSAGIAFPHQFNIV